MPIMVGSLPHIKIYIISSSYISRWLKRQFIENRMKAVYKTSDILSEPRERIRDKSEFNYFSRNFKHSLTIELLLPVVCDKGNLNRAGLIACSNGYPV